MIFAYFLCGCYLLKIYIDIFMYFWYTLVEVSRPVWRNGRRDGLKIRCWRQRVGSSPTTGTMLGSYKGHGYFLQLLNAIRGENVLF